MTIIESSVWIDAIRGVKNAQTVWLDAHVGDGDLGLTDLILCETLQGLRDDSFHRELRAQLLQFQVFESCGVDIALESAQNFRTLRKKGITIRGTIDCVTATFCIRGGHSLLHNDRDFDPFEKYLGLSVIHP